MTTPPPPQSPQPGHGPQFGGPPQPNPYGQPPHGSPQPNPYGQPQPPQGQGQPNPYGQPQGHPNPYGQPQPPHGQGPNQPPPPGGWGGQPPMQPPPSGNNKVKLAVIIGACAAVVALSVTLALVLGGSSDDDSSDAKDPGSSQAPQDKATDDPSADAEDEADPTEEAEDTNESGDYELTVPKTILDGDYKLLDDMSKQLQKDIDADAATAGEVEASGGSYGTSGDAGTLLVAGYQGDVGVPTLAKREFLQGTAQGANATVTVPRKDFDVDGVDSPVTCQVITQSQASTKVNMPVCAWAEDDILFSVILSDPGEVNSDPKSIDLNAESKRLVQALNDFRVDAD